MVVLSSFAARLLRSRLEKGKKSRMAGADAHSTGTGEEEGGLHECDLLCGKIPTCDKRDHRGPCPSYSRTTFEEVRSPSAL